MAFSRTTAAPSTFGSCATIASDLPASFVSVSIWMTSPRATAFAGFSARVHLKAAAGSAKRLSPTRTSAPFFDVERTMAVMTSVAADPSLQDGSFQVSGSTPSATRLRGFRKPERRS